MIIDGGNGGNKNSPNNDNGGSESGKNPKSSLRDELVELWRIELQSETTLLPASTCLEKLLEFNLASRHLQSYTRRVSKVHLRRETSLKYICMRGYTSSPTYPESIGEAARLPIKGGVKLKLLLKLGDSLYCLRLSKVSRVTEMLSPTCNQKRRHPVETRSAPKKLLRDNEIIYNKC